MNMFVRNVPLFAGLLACFVVSNAYSADIWTQERQYGNNIVGNKSLVNVVLEGEIKKGDYETLYNTLKELGPTKHTEVVLRSPGGDYSEGIKIGRLLRKTRISANVPSWRTNGPTCSADDGYPPPKNIKENCVCASACAFIFFGAAFRNGTVVGLHRPYFATAYFSSLSPDEAVQKYQSLVQISAEYLKEMGVGEDIQKRIMASASNDIDFLEPNYIKKYLWGWTPDIEEWILAKCPGAAPRVRTLELSQKFVAGSISNSENAELDAIFAADRKASPCVLEANAQLQQAGYKSVFGIPDKGK